MQRHAIHSPAPSPRIATLRAHRSHKPVARVAQHSPAGEAGENTVSTCPMLSALKPLPRNESVSDWDRLRLFSDPPGVHKMVLQDGRPFAQDKFMLFLPSLSIGDPALAKELLMSEGDKVVASWPESTRALFGEDALLTMSDMNKHRKIRTILSAAMGAAAVDDALPMIQELAGSYLERAIDATSGAGKTISGLTLLRGFTFQLVLRLTIGTNKATDEEVAALEKDFYTWVQPMFTPFTYNYPPWPFYYAVKARNRILDFLQGYVDRARQEVATGNARMSGRSQTILHDLVALSTNRDGESIKLQDAEVKDIIITLMFAGFDTSASTMTNTLYCLAQNPEVLQRVREEQDRLVKKHGNAITPEVMQQMRYTDAVVRETMRWQPPVAGVFRKSARDFELQGHLVPKDLFISFTFGFMASQDERWRDLQGDLHPSVFNPDRHLTEEGQKQGTQVQFGMGPRTCPGMVLSMAEQRVFLAVLARHYDFTADTDCGLDRSIVPRPSNNLPIYVTKRT